MDDFMIDALANVLLWFACMGAFWLIARAVLLRQIERELSERERHSD
jgi:hypothetical protein